MEPIDQHVEGDGFPTNATAPDVAVQPSPGLTLDCRKCNLKFKTREELSNHLSFFCQNSKYADIEKFKQSILQESYSGTGNQPNLSFEGIRNFINAGTGAIGKVSLAELRSQIRGDATAMADVKTEVLKQREKELLSNLRALKSNHSEIMSKRMEEETRIQTMIGDLDEQRSSEIRARMEKERVKDALQKIDKANLQALEIEKRQEIDELIKEQEFLKKKEMLALEEIQKLVGQIDTNNSKMESTPLKRSALSLPWGNQLENPVSATDFRQKFAQTGRNLGEEAAKLRIIRQQRMAERGAIVTKLEAMTRSTNGQTPSPTERISENQRRKLIETLKAKQTEEMATLVKMREKLESFQEEQNKEFSQPIQVSASESEVIIEEVQPQILTVASLSDKMTLADTTSQVFESVSDQGASASAPSRDVPLKSVSPEVNNRVRPTASAGAAEVHSKQSSPVTIESSNSAIVDNSNDNSAQIALIMDEIERLKNSVFQERETPSSESIKQDSIRHGRRNTSDATKYPAANVSPWNHAIEDPVFSAVASSNPIITQLQQQMSQTQIILQQHQSENARLQQELSDIEMSNDVQRLERQRRDFEATLRLMTAKLSSQAGIALPPDPESFDRPQHRHHRNADFSFGAESADLSRMSAINTRSVPKDSELYKIEMEHLTKLTKLRFQKEINKEELELSIIRQENELKVRELEQKRKHAEFMAEQQRKLEKQRIRQELVRDLPLSDFKVPLTIRYNAVDGFTVIWDFVYGLDKTQTAVRFVYQILDGGSPKSTVNQTKVFESQADGPSSSSNRICVCGLVSHFPRVPPLKSLKLLVEVQSQLAGPAGPGLPPQTQSIGWTMFDLFSDDSSLLTGSWKSPLYSGPIRKECPASSLKTLLKSYMHHSASVFLRISSAKDDSIQPGGDPDLVMQFYKEQFLHEAPIGLNWPGRDASQQPNEVNLEKYARTDRAASRRISRVNSLTEIQSRPNGTPESTPDKELPAEPEKKSLDVGFAIHSAELPYSFARIRLSLWSKEKQAVVQSPSDVDPWIWSSSYAQVGASGGLGVFEWESCCTFQRCPYDVAIMLLIEVIITSNRPNKGSVGVDISDGEEIVAYSLAEIMRNDKLCTGPNVLRFSTGPISWPFRPSSSLNDVCLTIEIFHGGQLPTLKTVCLLVDESNESTSILPWIEAKAANFNEELFEAGDGFDVYVDSCRFLPDNVLLSRVTLSCWTNDFGNIVGDSAKAVCHPESQIHCPRFDLRQEYRSHAFNPTCTLELVIEAIEQGSLKLKLVGVAVLNVFYLKHDRLQPSQAQQQEFCLNSGSFQLPLYVDLIRANGTFSVATYTTASKLPCATVLVRIVPAAKSSELGEVLSTKQVPESEWESSGLIVPALPYSRGYFQNYPLFKDGLLVYNSCYDSSRCHPSAIEAKLYNFLGKKDTVLVESVVDQLEGNAETISQQNSNDIMAWIEKKILEATLPAVKGRVPMVPIDLKHFAHYNPVTGFRIAIDAGYYIGDGQSLPFAVYSVSPPADFYKPFPLTEDVQVTGQWDWDSYLKWPMFLNGYTTFRDVDLNEFAIVVIDVRLLKVSSSSAGTVEPFGWTALQVFDSEGYIGMGTFQLPLFKGSPPMDILEMMQKEDIASVIWRESGKPGAKRRKALKLAPLTFMEPASVIVRIADSQLGNLAPSKFNLRATELLYVEWERRDKYECDLEQVSKGAMFGLGQKPQRLSKLMASSDGTVQQFETAMLKLIASNLAIDHLNR